MENKILYITFLWRNNGNSDRLYFLGLQNHCKWWLQPWNEKTFAPWKKNYDQLSILKSRHITLPTKVCLVKTIVFPVVMYGCESWTTKKAEHWSTDPFELWCRRRLLRVPWTARRSNQSILKEISPGYSLEGLMLRSNSNTLATWWEKLIHWKRSWCWERLKAGKEGDDRGWDGWMASLTQWTWVWASSGRWWRTGKPGMLQSMGSQRAGYDWATEQQQHYFLNSKFCDISFQTLLYINYTQEGFFS